MEEIYQFIKSGRWEEIAPAWMEILEKRIDADLLKQFHEMVQKLWQIGRRELVLELLKLTNTACAKSQDPSLLLQSIHLIMEYNPSQKGLIQEFIAAFKKLHENRPYLQEWIDKILEQHLPPSKFIQNLDKLVLFQEGSVVKHKSGWGIGKVIGICPEKMEIIVNLEKRPNHKINILAAADCLTLIDPDNLESLLVFDPERLKAEAFNEPLQLIYKVLKFTGCPTSTHEFKQYLCPNIISDKEWSKWWAKTRKMVIADPYIETCGEGHTKFTLREKPVSWEDEFIVHFKDVSIFEHSEVVLDYLKNSTEKKHVGHLSKVLAKSVCEHLQKQKPWLALECRLVLQECLNHGPLPPEDIPNIKDIIGSNAVMVFKHLRIPVLSQKTLESLIDCESKWEEHILTIFKEGTDLARDTLFRYLNRQHLLYKYIPDITHEILTHILSFPEAFLWLAKQIINDRIPMKENLPRLSELFKLLVQTTSTLKSLRQTDIVKQMLKLFTSSMANKLASSIDQSEAIKVSHIVDESSWLPSSFRDTLITHIRDTFPTAFITEKPIYTTKAGLEKHERELQYLLQHKIPENTKAIGHALAFGDISENAELTAAREEQFELAKKSQEMQNDLHRAMVIDFGDISTEHVSVGTQVTLSNDQGEKVQYTILGPWDVDAPQKIVSFMSPIAEMLLGMRVGETVTIHSGTYQINQISKYQEEKK